VNERRAAAHAKVNLTLAVAPRRPDGYHDLSTILVRLGLADRVTARSSGAPPSADASGDRLEVAGLSAGPDADNLVLRAAAALRRAIARPVPPLDFTLRKVVPMAAGLGGGSSDAAAALAVAGRSWELQLDRATRLRLAAAVGSDVPFFALGAAVAWATGRGEHLSALPSPAGGPACVLAVSAVGVSTAAVFEAFDRRPARPGRMRPAAAETTERLAAALRAGLGAAGLVAWAGELHDANDLWAALAALRPDVERLRSALQARSGRPWLLSGSGPTLFALYASLAEAHQAVAELGSWSAGQSAGVDLIATTVGAAHRRPSTGGAR
jgi:4-diphosphocytidyl-2-C-methyl-D-erythritol kinase